MGLDIVFFSYFAATSWLLLYIDKVKKLFAGLFSVVLLCLYFFKYILAESANNFVYNYKKTLTDVLKIWDFM